MIPKLRIISIFAATWVLTSSAAFAQVLQSVTIAWFPSPATNIVTYKVYYGFASRTYASTIPIGNTTNATLSGLLAGTNYFAAVTAVDSFGLESDFSNEISFTPINDPPVISAIPAQNINQNSSTALLAFTVGDSGTAASNLVVTANSSNPLLVPVAGILLGGSSANRTIMITPSPGQTGTAMITVTASDGLASASSSFVLTVTPLPAIILSSPPNGTSYAAPATVNLSAGVTGNGHTITKVQFYNGGTLLGESTAAPYSLTWNNVAAGSYSVSASVVYDTGSTLSSVPANLTVTNLPPIIGLNSPTNGATYFIPANINLSAIVIANGHSITKVQFYNLGTLLGETAVSPYTFIWSNAAAGGAKLSGTAIYDAGLAVASSPVSVSVTNNPLPAIVLTAPVNGGKFTAPATINLAATVIPNSHSITKVQFYSSGTLLGESTAAPYGLAWNNVNAGNYSVSAWVLYDAGSIVASASTSLTVTNSAPVVSLPPPWQTADIGNPGLAGSASVNGGVCTVTGAGNISGTADNFRFVYLPLSGDGEIWAQINSAQNGNSNGCFGIMVRENLTSSSTYSFLGISPDGTFRAQSRNATAANTAVSTYVAATPPKVWVKIARFGTMFYSFRSVDGLNWTMVTYNNIVMAANSFVGLAVASGSPSTLATVAFSNGSLSFNQAPVISLTTPTSGAIFAAPATINLSANVTANGHTINKVQFYNGTIPLGESSQAPYSFTWNNAAVGSVNLSAWAIYDGGSVVVSPSTSVTITGPSPGIVLTSPITGTAYTAPATISLAANVISNGNPVSKVQFYNGTNWLGETASPPYSFTWTNVSAGNYSLSAWVIYGAGSSGASVPASVLVTNPLPTIVLTSPANGANYAAPASINLAATVIANGHVVTKVQFYSGGTLLGESATAPYGLAWNNVNAGSYSVSAWAVYDGGSTVVSAPVSVNATNPPPGITLTSPINGSAYAAPATINLVATIASNGNPISKVQFYNGTNWLGETASPPYSFTWTNVSAGNYSLNAWVIYGAGSSAASVPASVLVTNPLPTIALTSPANGASYTAPASINLAATVIANGHVVTKVQFYSGGTLLGESATAPYGLAWNNVNVGSYSVSAWAVYDGGSTVVSAPVSLNATNPPPGTTLTSPINGSAYAAPATINLVGTIASNGNPISKVQFYNGTNWLGETASPPYSFTWTNVSAGNYSLSAWVIYGAGSSAASVPASVLVTNPLPTIVLTSPENGASYATPAIIPLSAGVVASGHSIVKVQFYNGANLLGETMASPYTLIWSNAAAGSASLSAWVIYDGGLAVASSPVSVNITNGVANVLPSIVVSLPAGGSVFTAPATINLAASVTANGHAIVKVQFYASGTFLGESGPPYSLTWSNVSSGTYSLSSRVVFDGGSSVDSVPVSIAVSSLPPPWQSIDIGSPGVSGNASVTGTVYTVSGAGYLGGSVDGFRFLYQTLAGDGQIVAQINSVQNTGTNGCVGVMIRESLTSSSKYGLMGLSTDGTLRVQYRTSSGGVTTSLPSGPGLPPAVWVKLARFGTTLYLFKSADGLSWAYSASCTLPTASNIYIGLAVASGTPATLNTSTFCNVSLMLY